MRNPNGYGSVVKLSGKRRKPFVARKTKGFSEKGYPIYETIGYYATREEGMLALADYNRNPYDLDAAKITMQDLYCRYREQRMPRLSHALQKQLANGYNHCAPLRDMPYKDIKRRHMQDCIDDCGCGHSMQASIKNLFRHLDTYALELDIITKAYSDLTTIAECPDSQRTPFSENEIKLLWECQYEAWVDSVLVLLYTGFRIMELLTIKTVDVDLAVGTIKGGLKTKSGKNRIVPIHTKIVHIIERRVADGNAYLFCRDGQPITHRVYYNIWDKIMKRLGMHHTPHECRHTFRSILDSAGANKVCIDLIMGHKSSEIGERIYTHKTIQELKNAIEMIKI